MEILIRINTKDDIIERKAKLWEDIAPRTVKAIIEALPIRGVVNRWGDEIYFETDVEIDVEENSKEIVELGDLAYWIPGRAICVFFGKTPISDEFIRPASAVNVIGKVLGDLEEFKKSKDGDEIEILKF